MLVIFIFSCSVAYAESCDVEKIYVSAQEQCDYNFAGSIPIIYKKIGTMPSGEVLIDKYIVDSNMNLLTGNVCQYIDDNLVSKSYVISGKEEGVGRAWYANGKLRWESNYIHGIPYGISKYYFENGELNKIFIYENGKAVSGECSNGYIWTKYEINKWNSGNKERDSVRNICK
jgi:hypothetical protein